MPDQPDRLPSAPETISEVLPSSRVLDAGAFERYAGALAGLIREAGGEGDLLRQAAELAGEERRTLGAAAAEVEAKVSRFAALIPALDERLREVEQLLSASAARAARTAEDLDDRIARAIREHFRGQMHRDMQPQIERLIAARLDGFLTDFGALTLPEDRRAA